MIAFKKVPKIEIWENFTSVLQMYDKIIIFATVKPMNYGNLLLSRALNAEK